MITLNPSVKYNNPSKYSPSKYSPSVYCPSFGMVPPKISLGQNDSFETVKTEQAVQGASQENILSTLKHNLVKALGYLVPEDTLKHMDSEESAELAQRYDEAIAQALASSKYWVV